MEWNKIYLGDAYELIKQVPDKCVDLIVTDPPYEFGTGGVGTGIFKGRNTINDTYASIRDNDLDKGIDNMAILPELIRVMKKINIYIWCNKQQIYDYLDFFVKKQNCNFEFIIWGKTNPPPFLGAHYLKDKEYCLYFWEKGVKVHPTYETGKTIYLTQINVSDKDEYDHPTIKDFNIIKNLISNSSEPNDLVFDPFSGSGTSACAAKELGRQFIAFEINEDYYKRSVDRLNGINRKGQMDLFVSSDYEQLDLFGGNEQ